MSDILIKGKGMKMPKNCLNCPLLGYVFECSALGETEMVENLNARKPNCPLIEVPPHGRLIDADALMKTCGMATDCCDCPNGEHGWCKRSQDAANICEAIEDAPTIIPAEEGE